MVDAEVRRARMERSMADENGCPGMHVLVAAPSKRFARCRAPAVTLPGLFARTRSLARGSGMNFSLARDSGMTLGGLACTFRVR